MNAVWNSYGQLCGCPEIFKKSCKFFCRELDIRVPEIVHATVKYNSSRRILVASTRWVHTLAIKLTC